MVCYCLRVADERASLNEVGGGALSATSRRAAAQNIIDIWQLQLAFSASRRIVLEGRVAGSGLPQTKH